MTTVFIKSKKFESLKKSVDQAEKSRKVGKVGWVKKSKYPDGLFVAAVAAVQEYGDPKNRIPPRPMLRPTADKKQNQWAKLVKDAAEKAFEKGGKLDDVLEVLVLTAAGDVRKTIASIETPPLSPVTIRNRLRKRKNKTKIGKLTKPLIDTGVMRDTVTGVVEDE